MRLFFLMISLSSLACALHMPVFFVFCLAEIEAKEACDWLRAAGFPQYAQLYEGNSNTLTKTQTAGLASDSHAASRSSPVLFFPSSCCRRLLRAAAFYFQAPVLIRRDGSWERPCYHCWDSSSPPLFILPPFPFLVMSAFSSTRVAWLPLCSCYLSCLYLRPSTFHCDPPPPPLLIMTLHNCRVSCI